MHLYDLIELNRYSDSNWITNERFRPNRLTQVSTEVSNVNSFARGCLTFFTLLCLIDSLKCKYCFHFPDQIPVLGIVAVGSGLALIIFGMSSFLIYRYVYGSELVNFAGFFSLIHFFFFLNGNPRKDFIQRSCRSQDLQDLQILRGDVESLNSSGLECINTNSILA